jgi:tetratricopeptide (TPR) repeat protein
VGFEVSLLGAVRVSWDGRALDLSGGRARAVFAVLMLHPGQVVPHERLAEYAWDSSGSPGAYESLAAAVNRLREVLDPAREQIVVRSVHGGFVAEVDPGAVDAHRFLALLDSAAAAPTAPMDVESGADVEADTDVEAAAGGRLQQALELWRGRTRALVDVQSTWLRRQAEVLEGRRLDALERVACLEVDAGRSRQAVELLREIVPAAERQGLAAVLIRALLGAGQGVRALQVAHAVTAELVQRGRQPEPALAAAMQATLGHPPVVAPYQGPRQGPRARRGPRQLPPDTAMFTGRDQEIEQVLALAERAGSGTSPGAVVINAIDGMGGIGKTALAVRAAHRLAGHFPDGQLFLDLHGFTQGSAPRDPLDALAVLLSALGVSPGRIPADLEARAALYRDQLAETSTLIVLDNALDEAQVSPLLPAASTCLVLITSRRRLKALDDAVPLPLDVLAIDQAVALLRKTARLAPDATDAANEPLLAQLEQAAELCGRLPLALVIAGALLRTGGNAWNLPVLIARLAARRPGHELAGYTDETRNLQAVFDVSYQHLPADQQHLFRRLGLLPGPEIDTYAAAALLHSDPDEADRLLGRLADHNLLTGTRPGRYRLHDLTRAHAHTLTVTLDPESDRDTAQNRLLHYYAHTAQTASLPIARLPRPVPAGSAPAHAPELTDPHTARAWLRTEYPNLQAAHAYADTRALASHTIALAAGLAEILHADGPWSRALQIHQAAADTAAHRHRPAAHAAALTDLGRMRYQTGDSPGAADTLARSVEVSRRFGDRLGEANALTNLGRLRYLTGDCPAAMDAFTQALEIYRQTGHLLGEANALTNLEYVRHVTGQRPQAGDGIMRALEIFRRLDNRLGEGNALRDLGRIRYLTGDYPAATRAFTQALEISREIGDRLGEANALNFLGRVRCVTGDYPEAADVVAQGLEISRRLGDRRGEAMGLYILGRVQYLTRSLPEAADTLTRALEISRRIGDRIDEFGTLIYLGRLRAETGDPSGAVDTLAQALEMCHQMGDRADGAWVLNHYAAAIVATGDRPRALTIYQQALTMSRELNRSPDEAAALEGIAEHHLTTGDALEGTEHLRRALEIYRRLEMRPDIDRVTARLMQLDLHR